MYQQEFKEANKVVHPVQTQWHYKTMTEAGFEAVTKEQIGFIRCYEYRKGDQIMYLHTGANANYWVDQNTKSLGYPQTLKKHLESTYDKHSNS